MRLVRVDSFEMGESKRTYLCNMVNGGFGLHCTALKGHRSAIVEVRGYNSARV